MGKCVRFEDGVMLEDLGRLGVPKMLHDLFTFSMEQLKMLGLQ